jgi:hypothetical protein
MTPFIAQVGGADLIIVRTFAARARRQGDAGGEVTANAAIFAQRCRQAGLFRSHSACDGVTRVVAPASAIDPSLMQASRSFPQT